MSDASKKSLTSLPVTESDGSACCSWLRSPLLSVCLGAVALVATLAAAYFAGQAGVAKPTAELQFPPIDAGSAVTSDDYSMATGIVGDQGEGLFVLDHNSGLLQCSILYPRARAGNMFLAMFTADVSKDLPAGGKGGKYIMTIGQSEFPSTSASPAAPAVAYVLDSSSGNWACYGIPFNRQNMNANRPQQGYMVLLGKGTANPIVERDGR